MRDVTYYITARRTEWRPVDSVVQSLVHSLVQGLLLDANWRPVDSVVQSLVQSSVQGLLLETNWRPLCGPCLVQALCDALCRPCATLVRIFHDHPPLRLEFWHKAVSTKSDRFWYLLSGVVQVTTVTHFGPVRCRCGALPGLRKSIISKQALQTHTHTFEFIGLC